MRVVDLVSFELPQGPLTAWTGVGATDSVIVGDPPPFVGYFQPVDGPVVWLHRSTSITWTAPAPAGPVAVHMVAKMSSNPDAECALVQWGTGAGAALNWDPTGFGLPGSRVPVDNGKLPLYSIITDGVTSTAYIDGEPVGSTAALPVSGSGLTLDNSVGLIGSVDVVRVICSSGPVEELHAEMVALVSGDEPPAPTMIAGLVGNIGWSASTMLTTEDLWEPPAPPVLIPGGAVEPPADPEPQDPPAAVKTEPLRRVSEIMPAPTLDARGNPIAWAPTSVISEPVGRVQIVVEGQDITYWGDAETPFPTYSRVEPFGADQATLQLPQITAFHQPGVGDLWWLHTGANVSIRRIIPNAPNTRVWRGVISGFGHDEDSGIFTVECLGVMFAADLQLRPPPFITTPQDAGRFIADTLNATVGRRFKKVDRVVTGCSTSVLGGWEPRVTGTVVQVLSTCVANGRQWTVKCADRSPELALKDTETVHWTVRNGQRGIAVNLVRDITQAPNVIYGEGVTPEGGRWRNAKYPNWEADRTPAYPGPMSMGMTVGYRDVDTRGGRGVSAWQDKAGQEVTGRLSQQDRVAWRRIQSDAGIQVDNFLGPQTWAATFQTGSNTGTLDGAFIAPLARSKQVEPYLYGPDGDLLGVNDAYNPDVVRVERYINFGAGVTRREGRRAAQEMLARDADPGWVGTVTFRLDPNEGSKFDVVKEGTNGSIRSFRGQTLRVHVARVEYREDEVVATVDTHARDYPTLDAILDRERSATDPARAYWKPSTVSSLVSERATWDVESPGGRIPKHAVFGGLWNVLRIPVAQYGTIVRTNFTASEAPAAFSVAVFDRPVTAADLVDMVGNPLTASENPWQAKANNLEMMGLVMAWGWKEQPGGYYPREYSNPDEKGAAPITGRLLDDSGWDYASTQPPWLWVAIIADRSCQVEGRFWQGPI